MATWASRLPAIRDDLDLSTARLGLVLLGLSIGSIAMLPFAGAIVRFLRPARTVIAAATLAMTGFTLVGLASTVLVLAGGLFLTGAGIGCWDVAMNVEAAEVERRLDRSIMPRFHAAFSLGTVGGAAGGALAAGFSVPVRVHLPLVAAVVLVSAVVATRTFLPVTTPVMRDAESRLPGAGATRGAAPATAAAAPAGSALSGQLAAWLESTTLLIGVLVFSMALAEGSANDWLALAVVDGYGADHAVGAICFGVFVTGMTAMRMVGPALLDRYDHVLVMRASAGFVFLGTAVVVGGAVLSGGGGAPGWFLLAALGGLLWGIGAALGFPMGMTAAAVDEEHSATRVGVVSTIGYTAFLAGPPLLGALGQRVGTAQSLVAVSGAVLLSLLTAGAVRQGRMAA
jgi:MFS family permease